MHVVSKKDLNSAELETMRTSRSPTTVMTANVNAQRREGATVYVKELDLFLKVMFLEETPAVPSLEKLCEDQSRVLALHSDQLSRDVALMLPSALGLVHSSCQALLDGTTAVIAL